MMAYLVISDVLLYLAVSLLAGLAVMQFVPVHRKPVITISKVFVGMAIAAIPIFTAAPVLQLVLLLTETASIAESVKIALTEFRIGQSLLISLALSSLWWMILIFNGSKYIQALLLLFSVVTIGYGSHSAAVEFWPGVLSHAVHVLTISLWAGVLLLVAWFSPNLTNWREFLRWFTPFAFSLMGIIFLSGFLVMLLFSAPTDYANSWVLPYGQMLLLKHLTIFPLLVAAMLNGFAIKKKEPSKTLLRLEAFMLLAIFFFTAMMSKLAPPHDISKTFATEGPAPFLGLFSSMQQLPVNAQMAFSLDGALLVVIGIVCFVFFILSIGRKLHGMFGSIFALLFVFFVYVGLMMNLKF